MANGYSDDHQAVITTGWWSTEHVAGVLVLGALLLLILIGRGFRGVSAGGVSVGIR